MIEIDAIRKARMNGVYSLRQLGTANRVPLKFENLLRGPDHAGWLLDELMEVVIRRTAYLDSIIPCAESARAIEHVTAAKNSLPVYLARGKIVAVDDGHIYEMMVGRTAVASVTFVKRSGGAVSYAEEWPGLQTQEVLRALIDRLMLHREHWEAADLCRMALWEYEARAYRRKRQEHNRARPEHRETVFPYSWQDIESRDIGDDGHIPFIESEIIYYGLFGGADPIPGADPFTVETDPVYQRAEQKLIDS